jgi:hypothetical protein
MEMTALSPTKLETARLCLARLKAKYSDYNDYNEEQGEPAKVGTLAHAAAKIWYRGSATRDDKTVVNAATPDIAFYEGMVECAQAKDFKGNPNSQLPGDPSGIDEARTMFNAIVGHYPKENLKVLYAERKYKGTLANGVPVSLIIDLIVDRGNGVCEVIDFKGLPLPTPLPTPTGWTTMGDVQLGDELFDILGNVCRVTAKSKAKTVDCVCLRFDDTKEVVCDIDHRWKLSDGRVVEASQLKVGHTIDVPGPIRCPDTELPVDPYVLGYWLGNGKHSSGEITSPDDFVWNEIRRRGYLIGGYDGGDNRCRAHTVIGLKQCLRELGVLNGSKHIPQVYLRASFEQRLDLLRGLMDSDGTANPFRKSAVFTNTNRTLADGVHALLLSLGQRPCLTKATFTGFGKTVEGYPTAFRPLGINPFLLPRKAEKIDPSWGPGRSSVRKIVSITKVAAQVTQCISVDSPDHTYLCTENLIPTHNTGFLSCSTDEMYDKDQVLMNLVAVSQDPDLMRYPSKQFSYYWVKKGFETGPVHLPPQSLADYENWLAMRYQEILNTEDPPETLNRFCKNCGRKAECKKYTTFLAEAYGVKNPEDIITIKPEDVKALTDEDLMAQVDRMASQMKMLETNVDNLKAELKGRLEAGGTKEIFGDRYKATLRQDPRSSYSTATVVSLAQQYGVNIVPLISVKKKDVDSAFSSIPAAQQALEMTMHRGATAPWVAVAANTKRKK